MRMRSLLFPSPPYPPGALTPGEAALIVVVIVVAGALALTGLPMFGALEFITGALYVAVRSLRTMRTAAALPPETA